MKAVVFIAVASIIVNTVKAVEPKQLNLALETVLQFDKKDRAADLAVLDKVQGFLDNIKNAMQTSGRRSSGNDITFTDFILKAAKILKSLKDDVLEEVYVVINDESRRYFNKNNELKELFDDNDMRRYVSEKLDDNKEMTANDLRRHIDAVIALIENKREAGGNTDLLEIGNTLYEGASAKLRKALSDLKKLRRGNEYNTGNLLRRGLASLAFLHYESLGNDVKTQFKKLLNNYLQTYIANNGPNGLRNYVTTTRRTSNQWETRKHRYYDKFTAHTKKTYLPKKINYSKNEPFKKPEIFVSNDDFKTLIGINEPQTYQPQSNQNSYSSFPSSSGAKYKPQSNQHSYSSFPSSSGAKYKPQSNQHSYSSFLSPSGAKYKPKLNQHSYSSYSSFLSSSEAKYKPQSNQQSYSSVLLPSQVKNKPYLSQIKPHDRWRYSNKGKHKKNLRTSKQESTESAESEEKVLMGGQNTQDPEITSNEFSRDREEDETSTEEILIQHSNVIDIGLSRKTPRRLSITFVSPENFRISNERQILRKSNANDSFAVDISPGYIDVVGTIIKHIEEEIEAVKDQVEYVKNVTHSKRIENTDSNRMENVTDAEALESNNTFSFGAQYDADASNSSDTDTNRNKTNENVSEITSTNVSDTTIANEEKEIAHEEHTSENSKNNNVDIDKSKKGESVEVNDNHYVNEDNHRQDVTSMSPNEKDKAEDSPANNTVVEVGNNSTATKIVEAGIAAGNRRDISE
ncbi:uncharacterized protein DDB_G0286591-like [Cydia fagiglandana]|uniref:uncharacterized protein DDB_G0286591-like n=1 Tax=Cydia fagiglandana TaxID=1458189 RepID=UPI002FEE145A